MPRFLIGQFESNRSGFFVEMVLINKSKMDMVCLCIHEVLEDEENVVLTTDP